LTEEKVVTEENRRKLLQILIEEKCFAGLKVCIKGYNDVDVFERNGKGGSGNGCEIKF